MQAAPIPKVSLVSAPPMPRVPPPVSPTRKAAAALSMDAMFPAPLLDSRTPQREPRPDPLVDITPSQGAGVHLAAIGPEDRYVTIKPERTFFRHVWSRHTNFAIQTHEDYFFGDFHLDRVNIAPISLLGDLLCDAWLQITLPAVSVPLGSSVAWVPYVGYALLRSVSLKIGNTTVESIGRAWMHLQHVLDTPEPKVAGLDAMVGKGPLDASQSHILHVPLPFFFCSRGAKKAKQPLPLVNMSNTTLQVIIEAESWANLLQVTGPAALPAPPVDIPCVLLYDYVMLSGEELSSFKVKGQHVLLETTMDVETPAYTISAGRSVGLYTVPVRLRTLNFPVTALYFLLHSEDAARTHQLFTYTPCKRAVLYLTNNTRFEERPSAYFGLLQHYCYGNRADASVGLYSFRLHASGTPSGHVCINAFDEPTLRISMPDGQGAGLQVTVIARVVNRLEIRNGFASLHQL